MKIYYNRKRLNHSLIFGILWLIISLLGIFIKDDPYWTDYCFLLVSFLYLGSYFYEKSNQYLTIQNGQIHKNYPFSKKINLSEIKRIKKSVGEYILQTDKTRLIVNTNFIDKKSLEDLNIELEKLNFNS
ncbi:MAG: hypothetical protein L3J25_00720 [Flavobacteriaceae bacterium]|nr:hypothetical protein [Flavobacteriaceae bacterium]